MKIKAAIVLAVFGMTTVLTACSSEQEQVAYCVDVNGVVLDEDYCDVDSEFYNPTYLLWLDSSDHDYKKGKKIPSADFRKGTISTPTAPKTSASKPPASTAPKTSAKPAPSTKAQAPKTQPKPQTPKPQAPKPAAPKPPAKTK